MKRKFGGEFIEELERENKVCSYCAEDCNYIEWLENKLTEARKAVNDGMSEYKLEKILQLCFPVDNARIKNAKKILIEIVDIISRENI